MVTHPIPPNFPLGKKYLQYITLNFTEKDITQNIYTDYTVPPVQYNCFHLWFSYLYYFLEKDNLSAPEPSALQQQMNLFEYTLEQIAVASRHLRHQQPLHLTFSPQISLSGEATLHTVILIGNIIRKGTPNTGQPHQ